MSRRGNMDENRNKLNNRCKWFCISARKEIRKGRVRGGIILAVSRKMKIITVKEITKGTLEGKLMYNEKRWRIITLYSQDIKETMEEIKEKVM